MSPPSVTKACETVHIPTSQVWPFVASSQSPQDTNMKSTQPDHDGNDTRNRPYLCETSVDSRETRLALYDGFTRVLSPGDGRSGPNYQLLRAFHEHHQHHHECVFSLVTSPVSVLPLLFQQNPFPSLPPGQPENRGETIDLYLPGPTYIFTDRFFQSMRLKNQVGP